MSKVSIITINYNNASGLEKTIESIVNQNFADFEYIVIDGASTDGSVDIIKKYSEKINYWVSEADSGIYNAMNKGIRQAKGEYLLFINSGDMIEVGIDFNQIIANVYDQDLVYFNLKVVYSDYSEIRSYSYNLNFEYFLHDGLPHPATFIKRELFIKYGFYNEQMNICSDWAFFMDMVCIKECTYRKINEYFSIFFFDGISSSESNQKKIKEEQRYYIAKELPKQYLYYKIYLDMRYQIYNWKKSIRQLLKKLLK